MSAESDGIRDKQDSLKNGKPAPLAQREDLSNEQIKREFRKLNWRDSWSTAAAARPPSDDNPPIETPANCSICNDSLWVLASSIEGRPGLIAVPCRCQANESISKSRLKTYAQLGHLERMTFESLLPDGRGTKVNATEFREAIAIAKKFASNPRDWLVIDGATGTGKTHLAAAIINAIVDGGKPAKYVSALGIPEMVINERNNPEEGNTFTPLLEAPVLAIDDFGAQQSNSWVDAKIDQLLTHRYNGRSATVFVLAKTASDLIDRYSSKLKDPDLTRQVHLTDTGTLAPEQHSGIAKSVMERMTFDTFDAAGAESSTPTERSTVYAAKNAALDFARASEDSKSWLYLNGETGVGKTHLAIAIAGLRAEQGAAVRYWSVPDLLDNLRQAYSSSNPSAFVDAFEATRNVELLILDDFGAPNTTDWALEKLFQIITFRYDRRMPTVIASQYINWESSDNRNWGRLEDKHYWESIKSRLGDTRVVTDRRIRAPDFRNRGG